MKKILYIILDGLGDLPIKELNNKTPLEAAVTPKLDSLAQKGMTGIVYPVGKGIAPESDIAVISLLGYDAHKVYSGRGPLECFAENIRVDDGDVAFRVNFATVDNEGRTIKDRRVGRNLSTEEATQLAKEINQKVTLSGGTFEFKNTIGHRGVLIIRGIRQSLSAWITNTDPAYDREGVFGIAKEKFDLVVLDSKPMPGYEGKKDAQAAAQLINEFTLKSHRVLQESKVNKKRISEGKVPANVILSRDAGDHLPKFTKISEMFKGLKFGSFVEMPVEKGIALLTGMSIVDVPEKTKDPKKDYGAWAKLAAQDIAKYDGLYIHIKGPDEPGHDGDFKAKKESVEDIDKYFFEPLLASIKLSDVIIAVTADHSTPCILKTHSGDPVPLLICGSTIKPDGSMSFSEKAAAKGSLGVILGRELLPKLIELSRK